MPSRLRDRIKRTGTKPNWGNPEPTTEIKFRPNPCRKCAYCTPKDEHELDFIFDICTHPKRIKDTARDWTVTNRKGEDCEFFEKGKQTKLAEFE